MPIRIQLEGDRSLVVDVSLEDWNKAFSKAMRGRSMLEIVEADGRVLAINPAQVQYLEEISDDPQREELAAPAPEEAREAVAG